MKNLKTKKYLKFPLQLIWQQQTKHLTTDFVTQIRKFTSQLLNVCLNLRKIFDMNTKYFKMVSGS